MIGREFLKGLDYNTLLHISERIGDAGYAEAADAAVDMGQGEEMQIALFAAMDFLVQHDIPVSYEDYQFFRV